MKTRILFSLLLFALPAVAVAQLKEAFQYTEDDGLAGIIIHDIVKDNNGIIWLATESGISKFDGAEFKNIHKTDGLPSNMVWALEVDDKNTVYAGCYQIGLAVIKNDTVVNTIHTYGRYPDSFMRLFFSRRYKRLFAGTNNGVFMLQDSSLVPVDFPKDPKRKTTLMNFTEADGRIFFTTSSINVDLCGLYELFPDTVNPEESYASMISNDGRNGAAFLDGHLYSSEHNKIFINTLNKKESQDMVIIDSTFSIRTMAPMNDSVLLLGGYWEGRFKGNVMFYNIRTKQAYAPDFRVNIQTVYDIYVDTTSKVIWLGSNKGLTSVYYSPFDYYQFKDIADITDIGFSGDSLLVLTPDRVYYMDHKGLVPLLTRQQIMDRILIEKRKSIRKYGMRTNSLLDNSRSYELIRFSQDSNHLLVCTANGVISVPDLKTYYPIGNEIFSIIDKNNAIGANKHMNVLFFCNFGDSITFTFPRLKTSFLTDIFKIIESNGVYYFASKYEGLFSKKDTRVQCLDETNSNIENNLTDLVKDNMGNVWCSSANGSLFQVEFGDSLRLVRTLNSATSGIIGNSCKWLFFTDEMLIISTDQGLNMISMESLYSDNPQVERFYNKYNGYGFLSSRSPVTDSNGNLFVFTTDKIIRILSEGKVVPKVLNIEFRDLRINGKSSSLETLFNSKLPYSTKNILFEFFAVKYPAAKNISYRYKVNNGEWYNSKEINLQSLRPGGYEIMMEVFDKESNQRYSRVVNIQIGTPFWFRWWFFALVALTISFVFLIVMRVRINRLKRFHEEKAALISRNSELKLRSLQLQMSPHFIFNALTSVQKFIMTKSAEEALVYLGNLASIIRTNLQNAAEEYIHLSYEIDFLKKYIEVEKMRFKDKLIANFTSNVGDDNIMLPPMLVQPIIENSIKHGIRNLEGIGVVNVDFSYKSDILVVTIEDNGVGREFTKSLKIPGHKSLGLGVIRQRLDLLNEKTLTDINRMEITDLTDGEKPSGTRVTLYLSVVKAE